MSDSDSENLNPEEVLLKRHRKEKKELQAKIQGLKKVASKGDKKKKKETNEEIAKLELELDHRHEAELADLKRNGATQDTAETKEIEGLPVALDKSLAVNEMGKDSEESERISKAQKRREKKAEKEKEREADIRRAELESRSGQRQIEAEKIKEKLTSRQLVLHEITADGDCLYNSVSHQLREMTGVNKSVTELRQSVADFLRSNVDDFLPFLTNQNTGDPMSLEEFEKYCHDLAKKPIWGGQIEIRALTQILKHPIEVVQAEGPLILVGDEFRPQPPLVISYHRHYFRLGEHYNSTKCKTSSE